MPTYFQRPENALKRANEFIDVGKKQRALDALCDVIKSKKHRTWQKIHEPIMEKYLELCVELRKSHIAKEGLYQYKNICQQVNINSLVDVVKKYIRLAEEKTDAARQESHQTVVDIDDLDQPDAPERLLKAVSGEDTQDRTDRAILTPWVKFLWESYRQCLDLLRNNSRVERLYQDIAQQAFQFCLKYGRKTEFRKLCDNLRTHLGHVHKHQHQQTAINLTNPDSQAMHLETRLVQLDSAINMELWQEAFKAVEDIYGLLNLSKKTPKPALMANYFNKISLVFYKSNHHLFHAATLHRLFHLSRDQRKNLSVEELQKMASKVLCATLAIPIPTSRNAIGQLLETDESSLEKKRRLTTLLMLPAPPTRQALIKDLVKFNVVQHVPPELQTLYRNLECDFHPLRLHDQVASAVDYIRKTDELAQYLPALEEIVIIRVLKQVAQVYQTVELSRLMKLLPFASRFYLERVIVNAAKQLELQVRIDHRTESLSFGTNLRVAQKEDVPEGPHIQNMPSEQIRIQMTQLAQALEKGVNLIKPKQKQDEAETIKQTIIKNYRMTCKEQHSRILARRQIIEDRKEQLEHMNDERERQEMEQVEEQRKRAYEAEMQRLEREAEERKKLRQEQEHQEIKRRHVKERIEQLRTTALGSKIFDKFQEEDLAEMDVDEIMQKQVEQLEKEKKDLMERLKAQEKKVDYMVRAKRQEEIPMLEQAWKGEKALLKQYWDEQEEERVKTEIEEKELAVVTKKRLARMVEDKDQFVSELQKRRANEYESNKEKYAAMLAEEKKKRLQDRKVQRKEERRTKWIKEREEERQRKKDEELVRERQEKERIERETREADEQAYQDKLAKLEEQAARQRAKEQEIEERQRKMAEEVVVTKGPETVEVPEKVWRPGPKEGGWREREKEREASWRPRRDQEDGPQRDEGEGGSWRDRREGNADREEVRVPRQVDRPREDRPGPEREEGPWRRRGEDARPPPPREDRIGGGLEGSWRAGPPKDEERGGGSSSWRGGGGGAKDEPDAWRRRGPPKEEKEPERERDGWRGRGGDDGGRFKRDDDSRGPPRGGDSWRGGRGGDDDWRRGPKPSHDEGEAWRRGGDRDRMPSRDVRRDDPRGFDREERRGGGFDREERRGGGFDREERRGGGFDREERRGGGFDREEKRGGGFDRDERRGGGGFDKDDWRGGGGGGGFDRGDRKERPERSGLDRDRRAPDREERRGGFDRDERRPGGLERGDRRAGRAEGDTEDGSKKKEKPSEEAGDDGWTTVRR